MELVSQENEKQKKARQQSQADVIQLNSFGGCTLRY